jgi:hypothetical protein
VPFKLHNERAHDVNAKVAKDMEKDEQELPETRWPFFPGARRKVAPTPVPAVPPLSQHELESLENKSARQRRLAIEQARRGGAFDDRQQKEAKLANKRIKQVRESWVTPRARWVTIRARWVTLRARWVTLRARWVTLRARWVTLRAR